MALIADIRHDSPFGRWRMARWAPAPRLARLVRVLWDLESDDAYTRERILPRTHFDLLINLGEPHRLFPADSAAPITFRRAWIAGLQQRFLDIESPRSSRLVGAELTPAGARALLRTPLGEIAGRVIEIEDIIGRDVSRLRQQLVEQRLAVERLQVLESWLDARTVARPMEPPVVALATLRIQETSGGYRIGHVARQAGVSHKHLITLFEEHVGLAPKSFARTVRFNALVNRLKGQVTADWGDVVQRFGYYDHPHFARELRQFAGASPTEFLSCRGPDGDSIVAQEVVAPK